jgi:DNA mismatch repair protein MutS2
MVAVRKAALMAVDLELRIRRMRIEEALPKLDHYLNSAFMAGLPWVRIVHGKGTGVLRQAVHEVLTGHPLVKSFRFGDWGEGGTGVTMVELSNHE